MGITRRKSLVAIGAALAGAFTPQIAVAQQFPRFRRRQKAKVCCYQHPPVHNTRLRLPAPCREYEKIAGVDHGAGSPPRFKFGTPYEFNVRSASITLANGSIAGSFHANRPGIVESKMFAGTTIRVVDWVINSSSLIDAYTLRFTATPSRVGVGNNDLTSAGLDISIGCDSSGPCHYADHYLFPNPGMITYYS